MSRRARALGRATVIVALVMGVGIAPLPAQETFDWERTVQHLEAIEEADPYRLKDLVGNGRPTLIAFIDHRCYTCLRSVAPVEELKERFAGRANVVVVNPARITAAHGWAKDHYHVWFVPKFVVLNGSGDVAKEYFGPPPARTLASDLDALVARQ